MPLDNPEFLFPEIPDGDDKADLIWFVLRLWRTPYLHHPSMVGPHSFHMCVSSAPSPSLGWGEHSTPTKPMKLLLLKFGIVGGWLIVSLFLNVCTWTSNKLPLKLTTCIRKEKKGEKFFKKRVRSRKIRHKQGFRQLSMTSYCLSCLCISYEFSV